MAKEEGDDEADLEGGVGRLGEGGLVAWRASKAMMPCVEGIILRCQRRCSCALTGSGLGDETDGVAWKGGARSKLGHQADFAVCCGM